MITFTDGLDTGSTNTANLPSLRQDPADGIWSAVRDYMNPGLSDDVNRTSLRDYALYIRDRLSAPTTHAYSIGVHGADATDINAFRETVQSLISPTGEAYFLDNYRQLEPQLSKIVDSQIRILSKPRFTFSLTTPVYPDDTKIRLTFDGKSAMGSSKFVDARLIRRENAGDLIEIVGRNVKLAENTLQLEGEPEGRTQFRFNFTLNEEINPKLVQQWYIQQTGGVQNWVRNSEHERVVIENYTFEYEDPTKSNVIYLVLDSSKSTEQDIEKIRSAAKQYIEKLYLEIAGSPAYAASSPAAPAPLGPARTLPAPAFTVGTVPAPPPLNALPAWWVQVGAYSQGENAAEALRILQSRGYQARITDVVQKGRRLQSVQAGPFATRQQAESALPKIRSIPGWFPDSYVSRE
jgi:hypothetical protein